VPVHCVLQPIEAVAFNDDGSEFLCTHADGSYVIWSTSNPRHPKENPYTPYGQLKCDSDGTVEVRSFYTESSSFLSFSMEQKRGLPFDNYRGTSMHLISGVCVIYCEFPGGATF